MTTSMHRRLLFLILIFLSSGLWAQSKIQKVEPPNWWAGMQYNKVQLLVYGEQIRDLKVEVNDPRIKLLAVHQAESPNYLFVDLEFDNNIQPGNYTLHFSSGNHSEEFLYPVLERETPAEKHVGFTPADIIYLIMPDRFANGNTANDNQPGMLEKVNRSNPDGRHGGDLKGISDHLNYIEDLGVSALWINPMLENNQASYSYHGYAILDFYRLDPRIGTNEEYKQFVQACHKKGLKVINDMIFNHCGSGHWWMNDLPFADWIHQFPEFTRSNFHSTVVIDPYVAEHDLNQMQHGWFDRNMPDLNQNNPFMANYLIQNSLWWIEFAGIDAIRIDTYSYPDQDFMDRWCRIARNEYPQISLLGEIWVGEPGVVAYWKQNGHNPALTSVFDFPLHDAIKKALNEEGGWTTGMARIYNLLAQDYLYETPQNNVIFCDNHDVNRIFESLGNDVQKMKIAVTLLLTTRGVPLIYYGTEILHTGSDRDGHGDIRRDFPGGWPGDDANWFELEGCSPEQLKFTEFFHDLIRYRNEMPALQTGKMKHFIPENDVYVYCRYNSDTSILVVINNSDQKQNLNLNRYKECFSNSLKAWDVFNEREINLKAPLTIDGKTALILELL